LTGTWISDIYLAIKRQPTPRDDEGAALFVRLPAKHARRLDRAAAALPAHKKDLIAGLVERYVDPETPQGLEELRVLAAAPGASIATRSSRSPPAGELPGREIAGQWRFLRRAVLDWLARAE
jgi:hypothetical protein